jgi:hypothetical protein
LRITVDVFSGRPNPVIELAGRAATEALARFKPARKLPREFAPPPPSILGYRGLIIEQVGKPARGLPRAFHVVDGHLRSPRHAHFTADPKVEDFVCGTAPTMDFGAHFRDVLLRQMALAALTRARLRGAPPKVFKAGPCHCAPLYEPAWWNDGYSGPRQPHNNCYNYATNYRTDTFAQPGRAAGAMYDPLNITCTTVRNGAIADQLIHAPTANNRCPKEGHLVALVTGSLDFNGFSIPDYHWYRKGRDGSWSHKPGGGAATNVDNSGNPIADPRTADRDGYYNFCTFMVVMHGHIKIQ